MWGGSTPNATSAGTTVVVLALGGDRVTKAGTCGGLSAHTEPARCRRSQGVGRRPSPSARSATPIRRQWTRVTVRGSVGASPSRSLNGESTVRWKCSPSSDSEQIGAIPQAHAWFPPSQTRIIVFLGLDPRKTMSLGVDGDTWPLASGEGPPCGRPPRNPRRSRTGRRLAPQGGDPFTNALARFPHSCMDR